MCKINVKMGLGLNLLCLAGACYISVKTLIMADEWMNKADHHKEFIAKCDAILKQLEKEKADE